MKRQIRQGVFETNSSSTHTISIVDKTEYDKWLNDELLYNIEKEKMLSLDEGTDFNLKLIQDEYCCGVTIPQACIDAYKKSGNLEELFENWAPYDLYYNDLDLYELYITHDNWLDYVERSYYENFYKSYKTKNDDEIVAFGYYGRD